MSPYVTAMITVKSGDKITEIQIKDKYLLDRMSTFSFSRKLAKQIRRAAAS